MCIREIKLDIFYSRWAPFYLIVLGAHNIMKSEQTQQRLTVQSFVVHPMYGLPNDDSNDFAVIRLTSAANLTDDVNSICISRTDPETKTQCVVAGWGWADSKNFI